jgi:hypothetical protein
VHLELRISPRIFGNVCDWRFFLFATGVNHKSFIILFGHLWEVEITYRWQNLPPVSLIPVSFHGAPWLANISKNFRKKIETVLMRNSGSGKKPIHEKTRSKKSRVTVPLMYYSLTIHLWTILICWPERQRGMAPCWLLNRVQWFSQLDRIHQQKDAKWYSLKCLLKKFFNWLSHFLRICILLFPKNTQICNPWPQKFVISFLTYEYQKNAEFYADFKSVLRIRIRDPVAFWPLDSQFNINLLRFDI